MNNQNKANNPQVGCNKRQINDDHQTALATEEIKIILNVMNAFTTDKYT